MTSANREPRDGGGEVFRKPRYTNLLQPLLFLAGGVFGACVGSISAPDGTKWSIPCGWSAPPSGIAWKGSSGRFYMESNQPFHRGGRSWHPNGDRIGLADALRRNRFGMARSGPGRRSSMGDTKYLLWNLRDSSRFWTPDIPLLDTTRTLQVPGAGAIRWTGRYFWNDADSLWAEARWDSTRSDDPIEVLLPAGSIDHKSTLRNLVPRRWRIGIGQDLTLNSGVLLASRPLMLVGPLNLLAPVAFEDPYARDVDADDESQKPPKHPDLRHGPRGLLMFQGRTGPMSVERIDLTRRGDVVVPGKPSKILSRKGGITISVDPVEANRSRLPALHDSDFRANFRPISPERTLEWTSGESGAKRLVQVNRAGHTFLDLFVTAWNEHRPVRLSPDAVWSILLDGYLAAVRKDPERVRKELVLHETGKVDLRAELDQSFPGRLRLRESWEEVAFQLLDSMDRHTVDDRHKRLQIRFTTTTPTRALARRFRTLDAYQDFFTYSGSVGCGIPSIRLEGVPEDWKRLRDKVEALRMTPTQAWVDGLRPVLDAFIATAEGRPPKNFWSSFVRFLPADPDCGEVDQIDGWISRLVYAPPLDWGTSDDPMFVPRIMEPLAFFAVNRAPADVGQVPFTLIEGTEERKFLFVSGFTGVNQDPDGTLSAETGWAVWEEHPTPPSVEPAQ